MSSPLSLTCFARNPEDPYSELKLEHRTIQVFFNPDSEEEEKIGRGGQAVKRFTVNMMVVRQLDASFTRVRLNKFVNQLKDQIRGKRMAGYVFTRLETPTKTDYQRLHEDSQYVSLTKITYSGTANA